MNCARMAVVDVYVILIDQVPVPVSYVGTAGTSTLLLHEIQRIQYKLLPAAGYQIIKSDLLLNKPQNYHGIF